MRFLGKHPWMLSLILIFVIAFPGFLRVEYINSKTDSVVNCVSDWADSTAKRTAIITQASAERTEALDELIRSFTTQDRQIILKELGEYVLASDKYRSIVKENPIPESPKLACI